MERRIVRRLREEGDRDMEGIGFWFMEEMRCCKIGCEW